MSAPHVALVTSTSHRDLDDDLAPAVDALASQEVRASTPAWDDPEVDWASFDLAVLRSPWDYSSRYEAFLAWLASTSCAVEVANHPDAVRWSLDKCYLLDLAADGVPVVPTTLVGPGATVPDDVLDGEVVVKPAVGAGSRHAARHHDPATARAHVRDLAAMGQRALVQPYLGSVERHGETAVVVFGGEVSHGLRKAAQLAADSPASDETRGPHEVRACAVGPAELSLARRALDAATRITGVPHLLYARVDVVEAPDGSPQLLELELAEPSFFLAEAPGAAARFADAVLAHLSAE